jgi:hypothetical protein
MGNVREHNGDLSGNDRGPEVAVLRLRQVAQDTGMPGFTTSA